MSTDPPAKSAQNEVLTNKSILEQIFTHLHVNVVEPRCCQIPSMEHAYHKLNQQREDDQCLDHMNDLHDSLLVCKTWASVAASHLWGHYAELHHILAVVYDITSDGLRVLEGSDEVHLLDSLFVD